MTMKQKTFEGGALFKLIGDKGEFEAIFSTFNVIDLDRDVTLPGAFTEGQKVRIAYWNHRWHDLPVGKGEIHQDEEKAWVHGQFFLDTQAGRETYQTVKNLGELQEWSYGYDIIESEYGQHEGEDVQFLKKLDVFEVSPVFLGAGIGTATTDIKSFLKSHPSWDESIKKELGKILDLKLARIDLIQRELSKEPFTNDSYRTIQMILETDQEQDEIFRKLLGTSEFAKKNQDSGKDPDETEEDEEDELPNEEDDDEAPPSKSSGFSPAVVKALVDSEFDND